MELENPFYLYRGTTVGWPGSKVFREQRITCTTTDPLVATLFAVRCRDLGHAVFLAARRGLFDELGSSMNFFSVEESAVNLRVAPLEFARAADVKLDVDRATETLDELGFRATPVRLRGPASLHQAILETHAAGLRLNAEEIRLFNLRMLETRS